MNIMIIHKQPEEPFLFRSLLFMELYGFFLRGGLEEYTFIDLQS